MSICSRKYCVYMFDMEWNKMKTVYITTLPQWFSLFSNVVCRVNFREEIIAIGLANYKHLFQLQISHHFGHQLCMLHIDIHMVVSISTVWTRIFRSNYDETWSGGGETCSLWLLITVYWELETNIHREREREKYFEWFAYGTNVSFMLNVRWVISFLLYIEYNKIVPKCQKLFAQNQ